MQYTEIMALYNDDMFTEYVNVPFELFIRQTGVSNWKWYDTLYWKSGPLKWIEMK